MSVMTEAKPEVEYDKGAHERNDQFVYDAFRHEDGSITYIVNDNDGEHCNPRTDDDCNVATIIQGNDRHLAIDSDDAGLSEARDRFYGYGQHGTTAPTYGRGGHSRHDRAYMMERYIAIFRPDVLHYEDWVSIGRDGYGWGYVTKELWEKHMLPEKPYEDTPEGRVQWADYKPSCTPEEAFKSELSLYEQWCNGEVYGAIHVSVGKPIVVLGEHGAYIDGYEEDEDSCWGFLGYDDHKDICDQFTDSPITEVLY